MLHYPIIDPVAFSLGPIKVHWYGLMYLLGFFSAWVLARFRAKHYHLPWTKEQISDLIFYAALGVIIGGRVGYMLFYNSAQFFTQPWILFKLWEGGMSFHGGLLGVALALWIFSRKFKKPFLEVGDFIAPLVPLGLAAGRAGNFINGELWGRVSDVPWAMVFPHSDGLPRHPSQLYELGMEGVLLFILVWWYASKPRPAGCVSAVFLIGYAICRLCAEFFREPDVQLGFIAFDWLTMGQLLSIPMLIAGIWLWWAKR
ncbi:prolipoprotein diacylglyceryl transferase [Legionella jordanis]|uniref:Phosphatidylglycerol--prolipoprotein diacylglyceryl transferase n=1 Tax=Legionella jordanis TaxID=456 RepID=A0A0W0VCF6_9GAMM|nr:prolipoprotein diacylglyceryl transferase [Legionella jordanis]KTD17799.1 prolipoprotein diacylglyceryl transferase [Legionella jordanis]RMX02498.1 prolipoprotein diacylglyceryl transferase [Legionella jordanis]RMX21659.1 prolipoprotein diacylglyceryl transferase [Legionella jordanis]VEH11264.1 prolipoprotein diacylglyceryltransferase [Legionella jordanis]HAT8713768.1 prolipoprotein diacylglyceryl transferase [Legionella jordanis]